ncbi:MAG: dihydrofolate reductase, partial [Candidatus Nanosalina sp.]
MEKIIVAAVAENGVIGDGNDIPWHYPEDMEHFRELTTGHPVVMGSNTYRSLPDDYRPLPGRTNIVLTRSDMEVDESVRLANSLDEAWAIAEKLDDQVYIIGGASVYEQTIEDADRMVITEIHREPEGDTHFPDWDPDNWEEVDRDDRQELSFVEY